MKSFLSPKLLIPIFVIIALLGFVLYILFAPETWWKPIYVRFEEDNVIPSQQVQTDGQVSEGAMSTAEIPGQMMLSSATTGVKPNESVIQAHLLAEFNNQAGPGIMYEIDPKVVNLAEPGGLRYLQTSVVLEFWPAIEDYYDLEEEEKLEAEAEFRSNIDTHRPAIDDTITSILSSKAFEEISTIDGKQALKEELMHSINEIMGYQGVVNVYFTDFVVQ